jgi:hypothetical protein
LLNAFHAARCTARHGVVATPYPLDANIGPFLE